MPGRFLAEVVTSKNVWARRYIHMILGRVHRCDRYQDLKKYSVSITRECMRYQNHVVSAIRPEIYETPYIGAGRLQKAAEAVREKAGRTGADPTGIGGEKRKPEICGGSPLLGQRYRRKISLEISGKSAHPTRRPWGTVGRRCAAWKPARL